MPVEIIAHRGLWKTPDEQNTLLAFQRAVEKGFGIELDVRDWEGELIVSHDPCLPRWERLFFKKLIEEINNTPIAVNVKSCGLAPLFKELELPKNIFFFDTATPDMWEYRACGLPYYVRYCPPHEPTVGGKLWNDAKGFYMDGIEDQPGGVHLITLPSKRTLVASAELHQREYLPQWGMYKRGKIPNFSIVTDHPEECRDFFK